VFSLDDSIIKSLIEKTLPSFQVTDLSTLNMGFGYLFYSFARVIRPKNTVVIGSKAGFSPISFALGVKDNQGFGIASIECYKTNLEENNTEAKVFFIDPSYSVARNDDKHYYGIGHWDDKNKVHKQWKKYGVDDVITHYKMTSQDFLNHKKCPKSIDLLYVDGDHSYEGIKHDFNKYYPLLNKDALVIAHDIHPNLAKEFPETGGYKVYEEIDLNKYEKFRLPIYPGLAFLRKR